MVSDEMDPRRATLTIVVTVDGGLESPVLFLYLRPRTPEVEVGT